MKKIILNVLAFLVFLVLEVLLLNTVESSLFPGLAALLLGAGYTTLLVRLIPQKRA